MPLDRTSLNEEVDYKIINYQTHPMLRRFREEEYLKEWPVPQYGGQIQN